MVFCGAPSNNFNAMIRVLYGSLLLLGLFAALSCHEVMEANKPPSNSDNTMTASVSQTRTDGGQATAPRRSRVGVYKPPNRKPITTTTTTTTTEAPVNNPDEQNNGTSGELGPRGNSGIGLRGLSSDFDLEQMANGKR